MPDSTLSHPAQPAIERYECTSAEELLDRLSPRRREWSGGAREWMFRGQSYDWSLKATAYRDEEPLMQLGMAPFADPTSDEPRWPVDSWRTSRVLRMFARELDRAGLPVPAPPPSFLRYTNRTLFVGEPELQALPTLALAQHHGLPTPLLDWSMQPRAAAYFACCDRVWKEPEPGTMVVWALRRDFVHSPAFDRPDGFRGRVGEVVLSVESVPRSGNSRLHAQAGLFTWLRGNGAHAQTVDGHVAALWQQVADGTLKVENGINAPVMRCFALDRQHAKPLLNLLHDEGVTAATIFPDYGGVAQSLKEQAWCGRAPAVQPIT